MAGLTVGLTLPVAVAGPSAAAEPAVETTIELPDPGRATVRTRIPAGDRFAGESGFHRLAGDPEQGWRRTAMRFERDPDRGFVFESEVEAGSDGWLRIPMPIPDAPPPPGTDLSFAAVVVPPPGHRIVDAFPSGVNDPGAGGALRIALPAPPSLLRFRVVPETSMGIGLTSVVDGVLALLLIGLGIFGARRLLGPGHPAGTSPP